MRSSLGLLVMSAVTVACSSAEKAGGAAPAGSCEAPPPPAAALLPVGTHDGTTIMVGGRALTPAGREVEVGGFPVEARLHPTLPLAYVANSGYARRGVQVVDRAAGTVVQDAERGEVFHGIALSPDAARLYTAGGDSGLVDVWAVDAQGRLTPAQQLSLGGHPAGLAPSPDGARLWVGLYLEEQLAEVDLATGAIARTFELGVRAYQVLHVPARGEVWTTGFGDTRVAVVDLAAGTAATLEVGSNPVGIAATADGRRVFVAVSDGDAVVAIDAASRAVVDTQRVGEPSIADAEGTPLPASSPSGLALDEAGGRLFVTRAADNAVGILDPATLDPLGAIPTGWYPTSVALAGSALVVTNAKGLGAGPLLAYGFGAESGKEQMSGTVSLIDLAALDLTAETARVEANVRRPSALYPFSCAGSFPVPTTRGGPSPIEHIVLIVRENKTYDSVLGDLETGDGDPSLALFGEGVTPNLHALARQFTNHDNFYDDSETSVQGHLWLTSSFVNDYVERTWLEDYRGNGGYAEDAPLERGQPDFGTFFTHLLRHGVSFTNYGEVVGSFGTWGDQTVFSHTDTRFPGVFYDTDVKDEEKAAYVASQLVDEGKFPRFTFVLLPNDHTHGTGAGSLTPEAMINDNDRATGLLVDRISKSPAWERTAIFIVQDDTQIGADHVDYHRSILLVVSPWAKRAHVSHVHGSYPAMFATFEHILGVPPMNRLDALATPLWDAFTNQPDYTPFDALARTIPDELNGAGASGASWSDQMDFGGPDRNPDLGAILWWARTGAPPAGSHVARQLAAGEPPRVSAEDDDGDDELERDLFDQGWQHLAAHLEAHPETPVDLRPMPSARRPFGGVGHRLAPWVRPAR